MGQAISRRVVPRLEKIVRKAEEANIKEAFDEIAEKKGREEAAKRAAAASLGDSNANRVSSTKVTSFAPQASHIIHDTSNPLTQRERMQEDYLRQTQAQQGQTNNGEMADVSFFCELSALNLVLISMIFLSTRTSNSLTHIPIFLISNLILQNNLKYYFTRHLNTIFTYLQDLLKFLNDMGPVGKKIDRKYTSKRILDKIDQSDESEEEIIRQMDLEQRRKRRELTFHNARIRSEYNVDEDGKPNMILTEAERISSMNNEKLDKVQVEAEEEEDGIVRYTEYELRNLLYNLSKESNGKSNPTEKSVSPDSDTNNTNGEVSVEDPVISISNYLSCPIIFKDDENDHYGVWPQDVRNAKKLGMEPISVPANLYIDKEQT